MDNNRLTEKFMDELSTTKYKTLRDLVDEYLEKAWNEGHNDGIEEMEEI